MSKVVDEGLDEEPGSAFRSDIENNNKAGTDGVDRSNFRVCIPFRMSGKDDPPLDRGGSRGRFLK